MLSRLSFYFFCVFIPAAGDGTICAFVGVVTVQGALFVLLVFMFPNSLITRRALNGIIGALGRHVGLSTCTRLKCACGDTTSPSGAFSVGQIVFVTSKGVARH